MSARAILQLKQVSYIPVRQIGAAENPELRSWTGHRNAPVAMFEDESPRTGWLEILHLAERLGAGAALIPGDVKERMQMVALNNELIGEGGWVWHMRLLMLGLGGAEQVDQAARKNPMYAQYGYSEKTHAEAKTAALERIVVFANHAKTQLNQSNFLIGDQLSALDIYWAYFSPHFH